MKFIITYGCDGLGSEQLAVEAENAEIALDYAYHSAQEYREGFAGLHGTQSFADFCEEEGYNIDDEDAWDSYHDMIEHEIEYFVETYDENNETHQWVLMIATISFGKYEEEERVKPFLF